MKVNQSYLSVAPTKTHDEPDTIYYDIVIPYKPNDNGFSPAIYQEQLNQPIVYNPQEYYLAVVRFQIPGSNLPIFIADIQPFPNTDPNLTIYSVTLTYNGNSSPQTYVEFISQLPFVSPGLPLSATHPNADPTPYYYVFEYTNFLTMINNALATAFAAIPGGTPVGSLPPYFIFDPITERISLIAQSAFYNQGPYGIVPALPIRVYINYALSSFIEGISSYVLNIGGGRDLLFNIRDLNGSNFYAPSGPVNPATVNPLTLLQMEQEYPTLVNWNSLQSIQIISNLLPINHEYVPNPSNTQSGVVSSQGILADFIPLVLLGPEARTTIEFVANGPWRFISMYGDYPITKVDLTFYWNDNLGRQFLIDIPRGKSVTAKLMFIKKDAVGNSSSTK
jgi:hypothetical protein